MKDKNIHWGRIIVMALSLLLIVGAGAYAAVQEVDLHQETKTKAAQNVQKEIEALYFEDGSTFLKKGIQESEVTKVRQEVDELNDRNEEKPGVEAMMVDVEERFEALTFLDKHFETADSEPPINGDEIAGLVVISEDTKAEDLKNFKNKFSDQMGKEDDPFFASVKKIVDEGTTQLKTSNDFQAKVKQLESNNNLTYEELDERIQELLARVDELDNKLLAKKLKSFILNSYSALSDQIAARLEQEARAANESEDRVKEIQEAIKAQREKVQQENERVNQDSDQKIQQQAEETGRTQAPRPQQSQQPQPQPQQPSNPAPAPQPNPQPQPEPQPEPPAPEQPQPEPETPAPAPEPEQPAPEPEAPSDGRVKTDSAGDGKYYFFDNGK